MDSLHERNKQKWEDTVNADCQCLRNCPDKYKTPEMIEQCIKKQGKLLAVVPDDLKTESLCLLAIQQDYEAARYVPAKFFTEKFCIECLKINWTTVKYIPDEFKTIEIYKDILKQVKFSKRFKNRLMSNQISLCLNYREYDEYQVLKHFISELDMPDTYSVDCEVLIMERNLCLRIIVDSYYDSETNIFTVEERYFEWCVTREFAEFQDFYLYLDGNLKETNLTEYNFEGVDRSLYCIDGAYLSSAILLEQGKYSVDFYNSYIEQIPKEILLQDVNNETAVVESETHIDEYGGKLNFYARNIFYITDIHLDHRLKRRFPEVGTFDEIRLFIQKLIKKMVETAYGYSDDDYLLIGGDVSCCFEISKIFYNELCKYWKPSNIVVILGNHEIWDCNGTQGTTLNNSLEEVIEKYKLLFSKLKISFLQNSLLIGERCLKRESSLKVSTRSVSRKISYRKSDKYSLSIISEQDILSKSAEELQAMTCESNLLIFGGVGFSAYNANFNATHGVYKKTITSLQSDLLYTQQSELVYNKLREALWQTELIVLSHMPPEDWSKCDKVPNWIYVNGHTHKNYCIQSCECTLYADNQMGYKSDNIGLKYFETEYDYDILRYYPDGIHHITQDQYLRFNRGKDIRCEWGRQIDDIVMLKREGMYMFLVENKNKKKFNLLDGGKLRRLEVADLDYYYRHMIKYSECIESFMWKYNEALQAISDNVKKIGGVGKIHGSIVDIDFFNHIYLSPQDGTVKAYYSPIFGERYEYESVEQLLCERLPEQFAKYKGLIGEANINLPSSGGIYTVDKTQYKFSRIAKSLQYVTEKNIIRIWSESLVLNDNPYLDEVPELLEK